MKLWLNKKRSLFLTSEQYLQFAAHPRCEFLHLKDFPSPYREMVAKTHEHNLRYGNILDVMDLEECDEKGRLSKVFFRFLLSNEHRKYLDLIARA